MARPGLNAPPRLPLDLAYNSHNLPLPIGAFMIRERTDMNEKGSSPTTKMQELENTVIRVDVASEAKSLYLAYMNSLPIIC